MDNIVAYSPFLLKGVGVTIALSVCSIMVAVLLGLASAMATMSNSALARRVASFYTTVVRGIPDLVFMLLLYNVGQVALNSLGAATGLWKFVELNQFVTGVIAIGVIFGAYMSETFRGAYMAIPRGTIEAGTALGMKRGILFRRIIWPQLIRYALPGFTNNWLGLMKTTALVSIVGLGDVVNNGFVAGRSTREPFKFMLIALIVYLLMTIISDIGLRALEKRYRRGVAPGVLR